MKKIYIDTNVFLNMYRSNLSKDISTIMKFIKDNINVFITTEQTKNEFIRNRTKTLKNTLEEFKKNSSISNYTTNYIRSLKSYSGFSRSLQNYCENRKRIIFELQELVENLEKDEVYKKFIGLCKPKYTISVSDEIVNLAYKRKLSGNPPTSEKYTCCDEIIWECLLDYGRINKNDIIIISADHTFSENILFLKSEYNKETGKQLFVFDDIVEAYISIGADVSVTVEEANDSLKWTEVIYNALINLGGQAGLKEIYEEAKEILYYNNMNKKLKNNAIESTIRGILQRFCSDSSSYNGSKDLFKMVSEGVWAIR